jgi:hypothetical protein
MKALLSLTLVSGLLITSTSSAFCLKKYGKEMNRMAASSQSTNFYNVASTVKSVGNGSVQSATVRK